VTPTTVHLTKPPRDFADCVSTPVQWAWRCAKPSQIDLCALATTHAQPNWEKQQLISGWVHHLQKQNVVAKQDVHQMAYC
jgi:hypothetical protein